MSEANKNDGFYNPAILKLHAIMKNSYVFEVSRRYSTIDDIEVDAIAIGKKDLYKILKDMETYEPEEEENKND